MTEISPHVRNVRMGPCLPRGSVRPQGPNKRERNVFESEKHSVQKNALGEFRKCGKEPVMSVREMLIWRSGNDVQPSHISSRLILLDSACVVDILYVIPHRRRMVGWLQRRGYDWDVVSRVLVELGLGFE